MADRFLYRIITFMGYPDYGSPRSMLLQGNKIITLGEKQRYYAVRQVFYDEDMTPMYAVPDPYEKRYASPQDLLEANPNRSPLKDSPILDQSNYLKVYNDEVKNI
jgi:hypothetical protein